MTRDPYERPTFFRMTRTPAPELPGRSWGWVRARDVWIICLGVAVFGWASGLALGWRVLLVVPLVVASAVWAWQVYADRRATPPAQPGEDGVSRASRR